ncbi:MAG TPA: hypothetical protein VKD90_12660 [Gemmataceae bacterium]|nr:hypothetical protein [Gemmataceae bacterium]
MQSRFCPSRNRPKLEILEGRDCPAVTATLADGVLTVVGDDGPNQVGVVELAGGVVKINADGEQFPLFAGVESIVIETFGGADRVEYGPASTAVVGDIGDRILNIDVGAGDDLVIVRDEAPITRTFTVRNSNTSIDLGTGRDFVRVDISHGSDVGVAVFSGDGGDDIGVALGPPAHLKWTPIELKRGVVTMDLGAGDNRVSVATGNVDDVEVNANTSDRGGPPLSGPGDRFALTFDNQGAGQPQTLHLAVKLRGNNRRDVFNRVTIDSRGFTDVSTDIDTGASNDWVSAKYRLMRPRPFDAPTHLAFDARLGDGDDVLDALFGGYVDAALSTDLGAGDDRAGLTVLLRRLANPQLPPSDPPTLAFDARLGDGDDVLNAQFAGYTDANLSLDFGAGTDRGGVILWVRDVTHDPMVGVDAQLGPGEDTLRLRTHGYDEVRARLDSGPDGDGHDEVAAAFVRPGLRRNLTTLLSADLDRFEILGVGYATADVGLQGHECLVFFLGGQP